MSVYDLLNVTVEEMGTIYYRVRTNEGYYMACPMYGENVYKTVGTFRVSYDFSLVQIVAEADLPEGAELNGGEYNDHEVMYVR